MSGRPAAKNKRDLKKRRKLWPGRPKGWASGLHSKWVRMGLGTSVCYCDIRRNIYLVLVPGSWQELLKLL
jgi:hypothetical protein